MNNLEFRALYKLTNKYANIDSIDFTKQIVVLISYPFVGSFGVDKVAFDEVIIEQYTGLKDKNGKKIYVGDRLSMTDEAGKNGIVTVGFEEGGFIVFKGLAWRYIGTYDKLKNNIEVVGNIHENPELLGKEVAK